MIYLYSHRKREMLRTQHSLNEVIFLKIEDVKEYLIKEREKAKTKLLDDKSNIELHSSVSIFHEIFEWIDKKEREERNEKFPTEVEIKG